MLYTSTNGENQVLPKFVTCGSAEQLDSKNLLCSRLLVAESTMRTSSAFCFWLFFCPSRRLRCFFCTLACSAGTCGGSRFHVFAGLYPTFFCGLEASFFRLFILRAANLLRRSCRWTRICLAMWLLQRQRAKNGRMDKSRTGSVRTGRIRHGCWWHTGSDLHHRWSVCRGRSQRFWGTTSLPGDGNQICKILSLGAVVFRISTMFEPFLGMSIDSSLERLQWRRVRS